MKRRNLSAMKKTNKLSLKISTIRHLIDLSLVAGGLPAGSVDSVCTVVLNRTTPLSACRCGD
jgi:hypothetical protein